MKKLKLKILALAICYFGFGAGPAWANFCEKLLSNLAYDIHSTYSGSVSSSDFKNSICGKFRETEREGKSFEGVATGYGNFSYSENVDKETMKKWCTNEHISTFDKKEQRSYIKMLNPSYGRAIESCSSTPNPAIRLTDHEISASSPALIDVTMEVTLNTKIKAIRKNGLKDCQIIGAEINHTIQPTITPIKITFSCLRIKPSSGNCTFEPAALRLYTENRGPITLFDLPKKCPPLHTKTLKWVKIEKDTRRSFRTNGNCSSSGKLNLSCNQPGHVGRTVTSAQGNPPNIVSWGLNTNHWLAWGATTAVLGEIHVNTRANCPPPDPEKEFKADVYQCLEVVELVQQ